MHSLRARFCHAGLVVVGFTAFYVAYFLPVFASGKQLLGADGLAFHYPAVYSKWSLWDPYSFSGHPRFGDPQQQLWYPLARLAALSPRLWSAYILSAYVLASSFCYGLAYRLTGSPLAGVTTGLVYGLSSFLQLHQPHVTILHAAAWPPLIFWAIEELRNQVRPAWIAVLGLAVGSCFLGGHPQIAIYALLAAGVFTLITLPGAPAGWWRYGLAVGAGTALGIAATMIQLLPTYELSTQCAREQISFEMFATYSVPGKQWPELVFPVVYGSDLVTSFSADADCVGLKPLLPVPLIGKWYVTEISVSPGTLGLLLALVGWLMALRFRIAWAWLVLALLALVYAAGDSTPVGEWLYRVPVLNKFRCPGRFAFVWYLSVAVLAGMGMAALRDARVRLPGVRVALAAAAVALLIALAWWTVRGQMATDDIFTRPRTRGPQVPAWSSVAAPWRNLTIGLPMVLFLLGVPLVCRLRYRPGLVPSLLLLFVLGADVGQTSWAAGLCYATTIERELPRSLPAHLLERRPDFVHNRERFFNPRETWLTHNVHTLLKVPSVSGYSQMTQGRYAQLLPRDHLHGSLFPRLTLVRYGCIDPDVPWCQEGVEWNGREFPNRPIGDRSFPGAMPQVGFQFRSVPATRIGVMTWLGYGVDIPQGTRVAELRVTADSGEVHVLPLLAGVHTACNAWERPDIRARIQHHLPEMRVMIPGHPTHPEPYHLYHSIALLDLPHPVVVRHVEVAWVGPNIGFLNLVRMTLIDERQTNPADRYCALREDLAWEVVEDIRGIQYLLRNKAELRPAWLVQQACVLPAEAMPGIIADAGRLPDGSTFDPDRVALVESPVGLDGAAPDPGATAQLVHDTPRRVAVQTSSRAAGILVLGDSYYSCWQARIDGKRADVFPVDYILRGVRVPAGQHRVEFVFHSRTLEIGKWVSLAALTILGLLLLGVGITARTRSG
jgi:hypothetical protein